MPVWTRDSIGYLIQQVVCLIATLVGFYKLRQYVLIKEELAWQLDSDHDQIMDFFDAFRPFLILIGLYFLKAALFKEDFQFFKMWIAKSMIALCIVASTYYDKTLGNGMPLIALAIPISTILIGQAVLDVLFTYMTKDPKRRMFYGLDASFKQVAVVGNCFATLIYCGCLFKWLQRVEYNSKNEHGEREDQEIV